MSNASRTTLRASSNRAARRSPPISSRVRKAPPTLDYPDQVRDAVKTLGQVMEYWLSDPQRAVELQRRLGSAYLELWGSAVKRMAGEESRARGQGRSEGQAVHRPGMVEQPVLRFSETGLSAFDRLGRAAGHRCRHARSAHPPESRILYPPDRECGVAVELRPHQPGTAARDACRPTPKISCAA